MKAFFLAVAMLGLLVLGAPDLRAQVYNPYYGFYPDVQYQQYLHYQHYLQAQQYLEYLRLNDPYYHVAVGNVKLLRQRRSS